MCRLLQLVAVMGEEGADPAEPLSVDEGNNTHHNGKCSNAIGGRQKT